MEIQVYEQVPGSTPKTLGFHTFAMLPRIGESVAVELEEGTQPYIGRVIAVVHAAEQSSLPEGVITISVTPVPD